MKKIIAVVIGLMMMFTLVACGNNDKNTTGNDNGTNSKVTNEGQTEKTDEYNGKTDSNGMPLDELEDDSDSSSKTSEKKDSGKSSGKSKNSKKSKERKNQKRIQKNPVIPETVSPLKAVQVMNCLR